MSWTTLTRADRGCLVDAVLANLPLPPAVTIKPWTEADFSAEVVVEPERREQGIVRALLEACHDLYPWTRVDLLSTDAADDFYRALGFWPLSGFRKSYRRG